jgi:hypothetical protein
MELAEVPPKLIGRQIIEDSIHIRRTRKTEVYCLLARRLHATGQVCPAELRLLLDLHPLLGMTSLHRRAVLNVPSRAVGVGNSPVSIDPKLLAHVILAQRVIPRLNELVTALPIRHTRDVRQTVSEVLKIFV